MVSDNRRIWLFYISAFVLLAGLGGAVLIYETSGDSTNRVIGYDEEGGSVYPVQPEDSKQYIRGLELYGGTANVLADELRGWFTGLWHGKSLAMMLAGISIAVSACIFYIANRLPPQKQGPGDRNQDVRQ